MLMPPDQAARLDLIDRMRGDLDHSISLRARSVDLSIEPGFVLGRAWVDPEAHEFTIAGKRARMQPRPLKVLVALHDKQGRVVSRDELIDRCWDGRIIGNDVINRCISLLRSFAAESGGFEIETISGAGYRLVEKAPEAKLEHRPKPWIVGGTVAAATAILTPTALVLWPIPAETCVSSIKSYPSASATGPMLPDRLSRLQPALREIGKRSAGSGRDRAVNPKSLGKFGGRSSSRIVIV
jgi:DNA-binding winged helix-turn-helix (wHTH) protein